MGLGIGKGTRLVPAGGGTFGRRIKTFHREKETHTLSLIHISEPTRLLSISYAVFCLKKKNN